MKPYISVKDTNGLEFQVTHLTVEPEIEIDGNIFYCVVAYDANHGLKKNVYGSRFIENAILELDAMLEELLPVMTKAAVEAWEREDEEE